MIKTEWKDFVGGNWTEEIDVRDFIQKITHHMMVMTAFFADLQMQPKHFGHK